ncbi:hypothetical protein FB451DRAFT_1176753 [Mycena latifolia]|nr:hypothetical protein FB451DRAFT_1176753 [Mycena latifolia]
MPALLVPILTVLMARSRGVSGIERALEESEISARAVQLTPSGFRAKFEPPRGSVREMQKNEVEVSAAFLAFMALVSSALPSVSTFGQMNPGAGGEECTQDPRSSEYSGCGLRHGEEQRADLEVLIVRDQDDLNSSGDHQAIRENTENNPAFKSRKESRPEERGASAC